MTPGISGPERPETWSGRNFHSDRIDNQAAVTVAGSIFTPGPMVEEMATRLT
jgi:hypothetical protein